MAGRERTLGFLMGCTVLIALDLAFLPEFLELFTAVPFLAFVLAALNLVLVRAVLLGRPVGTFEATFLIVGTVASFALTLTVLNRNSSLAGREGASAGSVLIAGAAGWLAARLRRPGSVRLRVAGSFLQGLALGLGVFMVVTVLIALFLPGPHRSGSPGWLAHTISLVAFPLLGGCWMAARGAGMRAGGEPNRGEASLDRSEGA